MWNFREWNDNATYLVLDDLDWDHVPCKKMLLGGQRNFNLSGKYMRPRRVKGGIPCIYLCNTQPNFGDIDAWIRANCTIIHLTQPLFQQ